MKKLSKCGIACFFLLGMVFLCSALLFLEITPFSLIRGKRFEVLFYSFISVEKPKVLEIVGVNGDIIKINSSGIVSLNNEVVCSNAPPHELFGKLYNLGLFSINDREFDQKLRAVNFHEAQKKKNGDESRVISFYVEEELVHRLYYWNRDSKVDPLRSRVIHDSLREVELFLNACEVLDDKKYFWVGYLGRE